MPRRLTKYGESVLKKRAVGVEKFDADLKKMADDLIETLYAENGLGLAAPQIGESARVFAIDMRRRADPDIPCPFTLDGRELPLDICMPLVAVNPKVEPIGARTEISEEGCLSFPGIYAEVERSFAVRMDYLDVAGTPHTLVCEGLFARCVQHENDHLDGVCFVDRISQRQLFSIESKLKRLKRQTRDFLREHRDQIGKD